MYEIQTIGLSHLSPKDNFQLLRIEYVENYFMARVVWAIDGIEDKTGAPVDFHRMLSGHFMLPDASLDSDLRKHLDSCIDVLTQAICQHFADKKSP